MLNIKPIIMNNYVDDHWLDILHQGAFVCFVVHIVCPVEVIAYSNASVIFTILFDFQ